MSIRIGLAALMAISLLTLPSTKAAISEVVYQGQGHCRQIALTFDTEFDPNVTPKLVEVLDANQARSTFFLVGKEVGQYPALVHAIADRHELANHTYHHVDMTAIEPAEQVRQVRMAEDAILGATGRTTKPIFRPPFGYFNETVLASVGEAGYAYLVHWSIAPDETATVDREVQDIVEGAFPGGITLFHGWTPNTPPALARALPILRERGYQFVTVTEVLGINRGERDWGGTPIHVQPGDRIESLGACYNTSPSFLSAYNGLVGEPFAGSILLTPHRQEVMVRLDGERLAFDAYPRLVSSSATVPVRTVAEAMGAQVSWVASTRTAVIQRGSTTIAFTLDSTTALVNGTAVQMPVASYLAGGRTMVPVRFLVETLGDGVSWDGPARTVLITTQ
jgi:peptidoglycan/xylan/chitin deacetylase (PgdA/CDA1 family)